MIQLTYKVLEYTFKYPFQIAKGIKTKQPALVLSLDFKRLMRGYGETTEISYYHTSVQDMAALLEKKRRVIESYNMNEPERFWHFLHHLLPENNFLIAALDMAGWDLWSKLNARSAQEVMKLPANNDLKTDYTIGICSPEEIKERVKAMPWPIYKLKLGGTEADETALKTLRDAAPEAVIRIDTNESWTWQHAERLLKTLAECQVELVEQPFLRDDFEALENFRKSTKIPVIADEACQDEKDVLRLLGKYDGINIKLSKCGGITPALRMIKMIKTAKKKVMLGGMCESNIGATALAQLLPLADYADIDGPLLFEQNLGKGITYDNGKIIFPYGPGFALQF